jgi:hypothetical protein
MKAYLLLCLLGCALSTPAADRTAASAWRLRASSKAAGGV